MALAKLGYEMKIMFIVVLVCGNMIADSLRKNVHVMGGWQQCC
jgi:hypothetical protein